MHGLILCNQHETRCKVGGRQPERRLNHRCKDQCCVSITHRESKMFRNGQDGQEEHGKTRTDNAVLIFVAGRLPFNWLPDRFYAAQYDK